MLPLYVSDVPLSCINTSAIAYHIPAHLIISVLNIERGKVGMLSKNKNNSYDIGPFQINSLWLKDLKPYGITQHTLQYDPCVNTKVAAWLLSKAIAGSQDLLMGVANYHSHTRAHNALYGQKVRMHLTQLKQILKDGDNYGGNIGADKSY
jgi:hypothetical protein